MSTDLERDLRRLGDDIILSTPSSDVLAHGDRMRRRRRAALGGGLAALVAISAVGGAVLLPSGPANPGLQPAVAAFTGAETDLTSEQLVAVAEGCGEEFNRVYSSEDAETGTQLSVGPIWELPAGTMPVAAEMRDGIAVSYFQEGDTAGDCIVTFGPGGSTRVMGASAGRVDPMAPGRHLEFQSQGASDPGPMGGDLTDMYAVLRVSDDVAAVGLRVGGETFQGSLTDGLALFWPDAPGLTRAEVDAAVFVARDADGAVLDTYDLGAPGAG